MLSPSEVKEVAADFCREAQTRDYVKLVLAPEFAADPHASELVVEVMEIVLHRRGLYIVPQARIQDAPVL